MDAVGYEWERSPGVTLWKKRERQGQTSFRLHQISPLLKGDETQSGSSSGAVALPVHKRHLCCVFKGLSIDSV